MHRRLVIAALAGLLSAGAALAEVTEEFQQTLPLAEGGVFSISNVNGGVDIEAWDRQEVEIQATKKARTQEYLDQIEVEIDSSDGRVEVDTHLPRGRNTRGSVSYHIRIPANVDVEAETVNGGLEVRGAGAGLDLESVNGAIEVEDAVGPVSIETVNGGIEARYAAEVPQGRHEFSSVNGGIEVYLPSSISGSFEAETVNGGIDTDFGLPVKKAKHGPMSSLDGRLGEGGPDFEFQTVNGGIEILEQ